MWRYFVAQINLWRALTAPQMSRYNVAWRPALETQDNAAPYASPENIERILDRVHKSGLKGKIDDDFIKQLGINETMIPRTRRTLEFLGLTTADGTATPLLNQFIVSDEAASKQILREALQTSYGMILRAANPEVDDRPKVFNAFKMMKPQGQWDRMTTLFLGLCRYAGMAVKEPPPNRAAKGEKRDQTREVVRRKAKPPGGSPGVLALPPAPTKPPLDPALEAFITKLRDVQTLDDLDEWMTAYRAAFTYVHRKSA